MTDGNFTIFCLSLCMGWRGSMKHLWRHFFWCISVSYNFWKGYWDESYKEMSSTFCFITYFFLNCRFLLENHWKAAIERKMFLLDINLYIDIYFTSGPGGYSGYFWVGMCRWASSDTLTARPCSSRILPPCCRLDAKNSLFQTCHSPGLYFCCSHAYTENHSLF